MQYSVLSESQRTAHASWTEACAQLRRGEGAGRDGCAGAVHGLAKARLLDYGVLRATWDSNIAWYMISNITEGWSSHIVLGSIIILLGNIWKPSLRTVKH